MNMIITRQTKYVNEEFPCHNCANEGTTICQMCGTVVTPSGTIKKPSKFVSKYGRKKFDNVVVPKSLRRIVIAIIADTARREKAVNMNAAAPEVLALYQHLNEMVNKAMRDVEQGIREFMMKDFLEGYGYNKSMMSPYIGQRAYYRRKRKVIADLAMYLCMI